MFNDKQKATPALAPLCTWLLLTFSHRMGKRSRETPAPLYRLHFALSFLWLTHPSPSSLIYEIWAVLCSFSIGLYYSTKF